MPSFLTTEVLIVWLRRDICKDSIVLYCHRVDDRDIVGQLDIGLQGVSYGYSLVFDH